MTSLCSSFGSTLFSMPYKFPVLFTLLFDINFHVLALLVIALSSLYIPPIEERAITNSAKTWKLISKSKVKRTGQMMHGNDRRVWNDKRQHRIPLMGRTLYF